jgi:hypothetical protein
MHIDDGLIIQVLSLADGADIHDVIGQVAIYRSVAIEGLDLTDIERELRCYVARKRLQRFGSDCLLIDINR